MPLPEDPCTPLPEAAEPQSITLPGGAVLQANLPTLSPPDPGDQSKALVGQAMSAMAPLVPLFQILDVVAALVDVVQAIPGALVPPSPSKLVDPLQRLASKAKQLVKLLPQVSVPVAVADTLAAVMGAVGGLEAQLQALADTQAQVDTLAARAGELGSSYGQDVAGCLQENLGAQMAALGQALGPLNQALGLINTLGALAGLPAAPALPSLGTDPQAALNAVSGAKGALATVATAAGSKDTTPPTGGPLNFTVQPPTSNTQEAGQVYGTGPKGNVAVWTGPYALGDGGPPGSGGGGGATGPTHFASASRSTAQSIPNNVTTLVQFDTVLDDDDSAFTPGAGWKWTAPYDGLYLIHAHVTWDSNTQATYVGLYKNGLTNAPQVLHQGYYPDGSQWHQTGGTALLQLAAGETLAVQVQQASGSARNIGATSSPGSRNFFRAVLLPSAAGSTPPGTPQGHELDADTLALWRLSDDSDPGKDETGNYPLLNTGTVACPSPFGPAAGRYFTNDYLQSGTALGTLATNFLGDVTIELWALCNNGSSLGNWVSVDAAGEEPANNCICNLGPSNQKMNFFWERAAGANITNNDSALDLLQPGRWAHYAAARYLEAGGTTMGVRYYLDGELQFIRTGLPLPEGGSSNHITLGYSLSGTPTYFSGAMADVRISSKARSDAEIRNSYLRGKGLV